MITFNTLTEVLEANRTDDRSITYIEGDKNEHVVSFQDLYDRALGLLHRFQKRGLTPDSELILLLNDNEQFIDAFWACLFGKIIPAPISVGMSDEHRLKVFRILRKLNDPFLYTDQKTLDRLSLFAESNNLADDFNKLKSKTIVTDYISDISQKGKKVQPQPEDIAFIQFSSGSTSEPRGVVLSHHNLLTNIKAIIESSAMTQEDVFLSWMPLTHDMGLIGFHLTPIVRNVPHYLMSTNFFIRRPLLWLQKASEKNANILCSPNFGYKHFLMAFHPQNVPDLDLSHVRLIFNGAEPISNELCDEFLNELAPYGLQRSAMFPVYGLAEASLAVTFPSVGKAFKTMSANRHSLALRNPVTLLEHEDPNAVSFVSVGRAIKDCQVRIADDTAGAKLDDNIIGYIQITGDNVTRGYYNDAASNQTAFTTDGWFNTGDLGFLTRGELTITGRAKDIIFVNGQNYYPHDLEAIAEKVGQIELGKVAACGVRSENSPTDEIVIFVLFKGAIEDFLPIVKEVKKHINEQTGLEVTHVIPIRKLPKTTSGKIQRYLLGENYLKGEFSATLATIKKLLAGLQSPDSHGRTELEKKLKWIFATFITDKNIGIHENMFEMGASSLTLAQIYEQIEKTWAGQIEITDFFDYPTISELSAYLEGKLKQSPRV